MSVKPLMASADARKIYVKEKKKNIPIRWHAAVDGSTLMTS